MKKVLIPTKLDGVAADLLKADGNYTVVQDGKTPLNELVAANKDTYAIIVRSEKVTAEIMDALPELRVVIRAGAGFDNVDTKYARKRGIDVMNTPGANANGVAEEVIAMMLADARFVVAADMTTRAGGWEKKNYLGREVTNKVVGVVGLGNIGRLVIRRLKGFDCKFLGFDPMVSSERAREIGVQLASLEEIFAQCDYITLHIPGGEGTKGLVDAKLINSMKTGATLVNCARYGIIDEEALRAVKAEKKLRYLNDVYAKDEAGAKPMVDIADLMLPHLGANTAEANFNAAQRAAEELIGLDQRGETAFIVNRDVPEGLDKAYCDLAFNIASLARQLAGDARIVKVETSFYGQLEAFGNWLLVSVLSGLWKDFDRYNDIKAAKKYLNELGIAYENRPADPDKGFDNSITLDITTEAGEGSLKVTSVRGTVAESVQMIARINEFDRLYFPATGAALFFLYDDRPGVIAAISRRLADAHINIEDMRNPLNCKSNRSLAIVKVSKPISADLLAVIAKEINAHSAVCATL